MTQIVGLAPHLPGHVRGPWWLTWATSKFPPSRNLSPRNWPRAFGWCRLASTWSTALSRVEELRGASQSVHPALLG